MNSKRIALCGVLCALGVVLMMLGGLFPLATFCSPALAALVLIPIIIETIGKWRWAHMCRLRHFRPPVFL